MFGTPFDIFTTIPVILAVVSVLFSIYYSFRAEKTKRASEEKIAEYIYREKKNQKISDNRKKRLDEIKNLNKNIKNRETLLNLIIKCNNSAIKSDVYNEFEKSMRVFADKLREIFESEYCAIGKVSNNIAEDCIVSFDKAKDNKTLIQQEEYVQKVKRVAVDDLHYNICQALASPGRKIYFGEESIADNDYCKAYEKHILNSHKINNTTIICIRDDNSINHGYIQFVNSKKTIKYDDIKPFNDALLSLIDIIINSQKNQKEIRQKSNILKDFNFFREIQNKTDNVDDLLNRIMDYLSKEFHAGIISFRIPVLIGADKRPIFILRDCYISKEIKKSEELRKHYFEDRYIRESEQMGGFDDFKCQNPQSIICDEARDSSYYDMISEENLHEKTLIIPIIRDVEEKDKCLKTGEKIKISECKEAKKCKTRFEDYYGIFKLRLFMDDAEKSFKGDNSIADEKFSDEITNRLIYLSEHISVLLNYIISKTENASLIAFQKQLRNSFFTKIQEFDGQCVSIIKEVIHPKYCAVYRFEPKKETLSLSVSSHEKFQIDNDSIGFDEPLDTIMNKCGILISSDDLDYMFGKGLPLFYLSKQRKALQMNTHHEESIMIIPMIRKDNTRIGLILLIGKNDNNGVSNVFWEHDIKIMSFIVNVFTRIEESDSERLNFLSQLSHELLRPVTESVYNNDLFIETANRNFSSFTKDDFFQEIKNNLDRNMLYKYIVEDVKYIHTQTKENIQYKFEEYSNPKELILDTIRLFEIGASDSKKHTFKTYLSEMPALYIDKYKMMQVFINLIKNAIRYADDNSEIKVSYDYNSVESVHEITISNYGIGVDESEKERIFELFYRGKNAKKKSVGGTGMGLFLVNEIMKAHKGRCFVKRLKNPTEFTLQLPNIDNT